MPPCPSDGQLELRRLKAPSILRNQAANMPLEEKCCPKNRGLGNGCTHIAGVLVLAGLELILFIVACMGLMFWICDEKSVDNTGMF